MYKNNFGGNSMMSSYSGLNICGFIQLLTGRAIKNEAALQVFLSWLVFGKFPMT